jgi:hypothetical protein
MPHAERLGRDFPSVRCRCFWSSIIRIRSLVKYLSTQVLTSFWPLSRSGHRCRSCAFTCQRSADTETVVSSRLWYRPAASAGGPFPPQLPHPTALVHSKRQLQLLPLLRRLPVPLTGGSHATVRRPAGGSPVGPAASESAVPLLLC